MLSNEGTNRIFVSTFEGRFAQRVSKDTLGAKRRITKTGKEVYELLFNTLTGYLEDVQLLDPPKDYPQIGRQWLFMVTDGDEVYELKLPLRSSMAYGLLFRLVNLDFSKPVKLRIGSSVGEDDIERYWCVFDQEGEKVPKFFTQENPNGLPALKKVTIDGVERNDHTNRIKFLERVVKERILPKIKDARPGVEVNLEPVEEVEAPPPTIDDVEYTDSDDLPF